MEEKKERETGYNRKSKDKRINREGRKLMLVREDRASSTGT